jgi:ferredoxin
MNVWIDQDLCTGDGLCEEISPSVFHLIDGLSYVLAPNGQPMLPGGPGSCAGIAPDLLDAVLDAAEECPGECIFIES